jgi:hypothetical protein
MIGLDGHIVLEVYEKLESKVNFYLLFEILLVLVNG